MVRVQEAQAGWDIASPVAGPARAVQAILGAVIPGVFAGTTFVSGRPTTCPDLAPAVGPVTSDPASGQEISSKSTPRASYTRAARWSRLYRRAP